MSERTEKLLAELSLEEKVGLMSGRDMWTNHAVERLGIAAMKVSDGPNGVRGRHFEGFTTAASFPCGSALGATFDPALVEEVGRAIGRELESKGAQLLLAPTINIHRSPLAGRNFECYSEDPHLSGRIAVAYVKGVQSQGVGATLKHYVCNDSEFERHTISSEVDERTLREIYLAPFEVAIKEASPWSVMTAYNKLDGTYCAEHTRLLQEILRDEWGFEGFVISDWFGAQSTEASVNAGLDFEMPGPVRHYGEKLVAAVKAGEVAQEVVDARARRMLEAHERAGLLDRVIADEEHANDLPEDRALIRRAASCAMVLLCNAGELLPLDAAKLSRVAVIGPNASVAVMQGGGSAQLAPHRCVSPLDGIRAALGSDVEVLNERGCENQRGTHPTLDTSHLEAGEDFATPELSVEYYAGLELEGEVLHREARRRAECVWLGDLAPGLDAHSFSARMRGRFVAPVSGSFTFSLKSKGRSRVFIDGNLVLDQWEDPGVGEAFYGGGTDIAEAPIAMEAGRAYEIVVEYSAPGEDGWIGFNVGCLVPDPADGMDRAISAAEAADCAIVIVGLNNHWETEGSDRVDMELPGRQVELIERVSAANANTIVVVNAGSPIAMEFADRVPAILQLWYPGQEMGHALADVLFGAASPGGRLPCTFPMEYADHPAFAHYPGKDGRVEYGEGLMVGYRHYDTRGVEPRFAFGHGLSYSRFEYGDIRLARETVARGETVEFEIDVRNSGERRSSDVAQVYVHDFESRLPRPEQELRAFEKFELDPGESATLRFRLDERALAFYDPAIRDWEVEAGRFEVRVGASSRDIRARASFDVVAD